MASRGERFLFCPDCGKRGVKWAARRHGEDNYYCRYCDWYAYTRGSASIDELHRDRLKAANPEMTETL